MPTKKQKVSPNDEIFLIDRSDSLQEVTLQLNEGESVVVMGEGALVLEQGSVSLNGYLVSDEGARIPLKCDENFPICIQSGGGASNGNMVPYVSAQYAVVRLACCSSSEGSWLRVVKLSKSQGGAFYPVEWLEASCDIAGRIQESTGESTFVICVCGSKNVGKSSFCRYLVNRLLRDHTTVQYLDIDCGQPEFTPPGMVSLVDISTPILDPPYLQQVSRPTISYFVGDTSPASDIPLYVRYVHQLYAYASARVTVVNTHGWIQGLGFDVMKQSLAGMHVTHLVRLHGDQSKPHLTPSTIVTNQDHENLLDYVLPAISSTATPSCVAARELRHLLASRYSIKATRAVEKRNTQWISFCLQCCHEQVTSRRISDDTAVAVLLASHMPYSICLDDIAISCQFAELQSSQALRVVNGSIVGLCSISHNESGIDDQPLMRCHGLGIVRSVMPETGTLYLLTPLQEEVLASVDCIVVGRVDLPSNLLQTDGLKSPYLAIHGLSSDGTAAGQGKSRNNLLRQRSIVQ